METLTASTKKHNHYWKTSFKQEEAQSSHTLPETQPGLERLLRKNQAVTTLTSAISSGCTMVLTALEVPGTPGTALPAPAAAPCSHSSHVLWLSGPSQSTHSPSRGPSKKERGAAGTQQCPCSFWLCCEYHQHLATSTMH